MNKTILGFVVVALFLVAGLFEFAGQQPILGTVFVLLAIANLIIFLKFRKLNKD
jgi:hypothetical protein